MQDAGLSPLQRQVVRRLAAAGTWVARAALADLTGCVPALDDALADLVTAGTAQHRAQAGYRLALDTLARGALADLLADAGLTKAVRGAVVARALRLGVAQRTADGGLLAFSLALPEQASSAQAAQQGAAAMALIATQFEAARA